MSPFVRTPWRWWPILVTCISVAFIAYGIILVSRSSSLQQRISHEVKLLEELNGISESIHQLGLVHRVDLSAQQHQWDNELQKLRTTIEHTKAAYSDSPGMDEMPAALDRSLHQTDSLHDQIIAHQGTWSTLRSQEAVLQIMLQRSQKVVDNMAHRREQQVAPTLSREHATTGGARDHAEQGGEGGDAEGDPPPGEEQPADRQEPDPLPDGPGEG
jgi:hypothetical protein